MGLSQGEHSRKAKVWEDLACVRTEVQDLAPAASVRAGGQGIVWGWQAHFLEEDQTLMSLCFK